MAGIRLKLKSVGAPVLDTFAVSGALAGSKTNYGGRTWTKVGAGDTTVSKSGGVAKATGGTSNTFLVLDTGGHNFDAGIKIEKLASPTSITAIAVRVFSEANNFYLALRSAADVAEYTLIKRANNVITQLVNTGVAPKPGDMVLLSVRNHVATIKVNGKDIGSATLDSLGSTFNAGLLFNGQDTVTEIHDFALYPGS